MRRQSTSQNHVAQTRMRPPVIKIEEPIGGLYIWNLANKPVFIQINKIRNHQLDIAAETTQYHQSNNAPNEIDRQLNEWTYTLPSELFDDPNEVPFQDMFK